MPPLVRSLVRSAFAPISAGPDDRTDAELLARFMTQQDAAAFEVLLRRHGPMVRAVCRGVLRNPADADDAFQATFLVLVRRAGAIRDRAAVGAWLYGVAGRVSRKLRSQVRPHAALPDDLPAPPAPDASFDTRAVLEEEVARLPERYRLVVQACYVAGQTTAEAAARLGWAKGTVLTRLAWARKRLRARLSARGVSLTVGGFGTLLSRPAARAVGRELRDATSRAAMAVVYGGGVAGAASDRSVTLSEGVIRAMVVNKLKWIGGAVLAAAVLAGVGVGRWTAEAAGEPQAKNKPVPQSRDLPPARDELLPPPNVPQSPADPLIGAPRRGVVPPTPVAENLPSPVPSSHTIPPPSVPTVGGAGKTFIVSRPVGTWTREVALDNSIARITAKFEEDRLTISYTQAEGKQSVEVVVEADYSITRDSVVFGVVTGFDMTEVGANAPSKEAGALTDQPFAFRYRVDNGVLTIKDIKLPEAVQSAEVLALVAGRYTSPDDAAAPAKPKPKPVAPRRGNAPVPSFIPSPGIPGDPNLVPYFALPGAPGVTPGPR